MTLPHVPAVHRPTVGARLSLLSLGALTLVGACKTVANDGRDRPPTAVGSAARAGDGGAAPAGSSSAAAPAVLAAVAPEAPLAWGTRPPATGPLYPVVDGMCIHGEIWPLAGRDALYTYGNGNGPWSRGSSTTYARLVDDGIDTSGAIGVAAPGPKEEVRAGLAVLAPQAVVGTWPGPLLVWGDEQGNGRMRDYPSLWAYGDAGFRPLASWQDQGNPDVAAPVLFKGNAVTYLRFYRDPSFDNLDETPTFKAIPVEKDAAVLNVSGLSLPKLHVGAIAADDTSIYVVGSQPSGPNAGVSVLVVWTDGKVRRLVVPEDVGRIVGVRPALLLKSAAGIYRLEGEKLVGVPLRGFEGGGLLAVEEAPNGDLWGLRKERKSVVVAHLRPEGVTIEEHALPAPRAPGAHENVQHWPSSGGPLAGVAVDDPWVIGEGGSLYHFEGGAFREVELPAPPFAATGRYQAQALVVPRKGDVFVNAGYAEKGIGWKTVERYRAVLRTKRPKEVLRCTEPGGGSVYGSGAGFLSSPPIAGDACATPFTVLLRVAWGVGTKTETWSYDRKSDYPRVREAIKATPSLGASVDLVEYVSGTQRFLGVATPTAAAGRELAAAVAKRVVNVVETRPEVVCGTPTAARTLHVDVATGKVASVGAPAQ